MAHNCLKSTEDMSCHKHRITDALVTECPFGDKLEIIKWGCD